MPKRGLFQEKEKGNKKYNTFSMNFEEVWKLTKRIIGAFKSQEEALETLDALEAEGYLTKDLQIFTTNKDSDTLRGSTEVFVESGEAESEKEAKQSLVDKVKSAVPFLDEPEEPSKVKTKLIEIGVPEEEVSKYAPAGDSGTIFIIAEENPDGSAAIGTSKKKLVVREDAASREFSSSDIEEIGERQDMNITAESQNESLAEPPGETKSTATDEDIDPALSGANPPLDKSGEIPAESRQPADERGTETPVPPNPPVGGIDNVHGNSDLETVREEGIPMDHQHTPLDKTEEDMEKRNEQKKDDNKK